VRYVLTLVAAVTVYSHPACSLKVSRGMRRQWDLSMCQEGSTTPTEASCLGTSTVHPWWACCQYGCWRIIIQNQSCRLSISFSIYDTQVSTGVVSLKPGFPFQILFAPLEKKLWNKIWNGKPGLNAIECFVSILIHLAILVKLA